MVLIAEFVEKDITTFQKVLQYVNSVNFVVVSSVCWQFSGFVVYAERYCRK